MNEGLSSPDAQTVLRELDDDGRLGLRDAPDMLLDGLRQHTRGFPRALEAVKAILDGDDTLTPRDLLDRTRHLSEDQVVQVLVGDAYDLLDTPGQQVMQALSVYPAPVSAVGVNFLLRSVSPTTDAAPILTRLVRRQLVRFHDARYYLHPTDRDYARSQLPAGSQDDPATAFTLTGLQARAADYYAQIRTPRESWSTLEDIQPQLAEFELRCDTGDYDTAARVLQDIGFKYLRVWGHYRTLIDLHMRIHGQTTDPVLSISHLSDLMICHLILGHYRRAIDLNTQALDIARNSGDRGWEGVELGNRGTYHLHVGDYRQAMNLYTQALEIARDVGDRTGEGARMGNLGLCYYCLGEYRKAIDLHTQSLDIARRIGHGEFESNELGYLGLCHYCLGEYRQAMDLYTQALDIARNIGHHYGEANALNYLGRARLASGDVPGAVMLLEQAARVADASGNIESAAEARSGLALAQLLMGDPAAALATITSPRDPPYPPEEPTIRLLEGLALLELHRVGEGMRAFRDALVAADALLTLADSNVAALRVRALALSGLAVATGDATPAAEAMEAFARANTINDALGVAADTRRLLDRITRHDRSGILAEVRAAQDP